LLVFFIYSIFFIMPAEQVRGFIHSDYNKVADVRLLDFFLNLSVVPLTVIIILILVSLPLRNPFCRFFCPYGALLGLAALVSPAKVNRDNTTCVSCGVCNQFCPTYIPVMAKRRVHSPECIGCWRCISHCRSEGALAMKLPGGKFAIPGIIFALLVVLLFVGGTVAGKVTGHWRTGVTYDEYMRLLQPPPR
jgi:polyferredoxin